ncbi:MAG: hypothetical protein E7568_06745 [Ruminococcaceae bacterium]|nr:hypothetical protein [Oscillospiraceae bacterium]
MKFDKLTKQQQAAVLEKGSILVSAAAGSGKTAVLVERIIKELTKKDETLSADRMLVVTFTNSAAAEMRARLEKGIDEYCAENPKDKSAARQKILLQTAGISTIDSYCISMVRENFDKANVEIDFKIVEENDLETLKDTAIKTVFEKYFKNEDELFVSLLDAFGSLYDDSDLADAVKQIYRVSQDMPFPSVWLAKMEERYSNNSFSLWCEEAIVQARAYFETARRYVLSAEKYFTADEKIKKAYGSSFEYARESLEKAIDTAESKDWNALFDLMPIVKFDSFARGVAADDKNGIRVKKIREFAEKMIEKAKKLIYDSKDAVYQHFITTAPLNILLFKLTEEFTAELNKLLIEKNTYSFSDIEHKAFELLCEYKDGEIVLRKDADEFIDRYDEIFVDEYQDVNDLQDKFFYYLSNMGKKLFVVGDVKQSIYGFRGANPDNFLNKQKTAVDYKEAQKDDIKSITLDANFRSKDEICLFINHIFDRIMTEEFCGIDYKATERLFPAAVFPVTDTPACEVHITDSMGEKEKVAESAHIADYILSVMNSGEVIRDKKTGKLRKARFSDFAVLVRYLKPVAATIAQEFLKRGIPVSYSKEGLLQSKEIKTILALLQVIDNPTRDIELLSVLMSPLFCFTSDYVAKIRIDKRKCSLYSAVINSANNGDEKCKSFLSFIAGLRKYAAIMPLSKLIAHIYDVTDYMNVVSLMSEPDGRRANLNYLISLAENFENTGNSGIFAFKKHLEALDNGKLKGTAMNAGSDCVNLITIHYSKGLQYPVCILGFSGSGFSNKDQKSSVLIDTNRGISFSYYNDDEGKINPIDKRLLSIYLKKNQLKEELRMLYVALTRAEDRLMISMARKNVDSFLVNCAVKLEASENIINEDIYFAASCYADWIIPCMLLHDGGETFRSKAGYKLQAEDSVGNVLSLICDFSDSKTEESQETIQIDSGIAKRIKENIVYEYPYDILRKIESKSAVSVMVHKSEEGNYDFTSTPGFLNSSGLTYAQRGTAVHKIMQYMNFDNAVADFEKEIERLLEWEYISEEEAKVDTVHIKRFIESDLFKRMYASDTLKREMKFLTFVPAGNIHEDMPESLKDEKIVVQGAVDCMFVENGEIVIVDFKTDRVKSEKRLIDAYAEQLNIYAVACEKIIGLKVKEKIIYSLVLDRSIVI